MDIAARRVFRLSLTTALALAGGYALALDLPYLAPLFGFMLTAAPKPPMGFKGYIGVSLVLSLTLGVGLILVPMLMYYPATALMLVLLGLFFSNYLSLNMGKAQVGLLLTVGVTMISAAGTLTFALATTLIEAMIISIGLALVCQSIVYPFFPEDEGPIAAPPAVSPEESSWLAFRATLIIFPSYLLVLLNPAAYLPVIMKAVLLGQQANVTNARVAGRELLGSTFMGGVLAIIFWAGLSMAPNLWMFFLWTLLFGIYISAKLYGLFYSRYSPGFWQNAMVTLFILLGPAVADSATGKDVYKAFAVRIGLFIAITLYAWLALVVLDRWYHQRGNRSSLQTTALGAAS